MVPNNDTHQKDHLYMAPDSWFIGQSVSCWERGLILWRLLWEWRKIKEYMFYDTWPLISCKNIHSFLALSREIFSLWETYALLMQEPSNPSFSLFSVFIMLDHWYWKSVHVSLSVSVSCESPWWEKSGWKLITSDVSERTRNPLNTMLPDRIWSSYELFEPWKCLVQVSSAFDHPPSPPQNGHLTLQTLFPCFKVFLHVLYVKRIEMGGWSD